jgi:hypothetical protein
MKKLLIDIGSSTVKAYEQTGPATVRQLETKSFHFKEDFDADAGITEANKTCRGDPERWVRVPAWGAGLPAAFRARNRGSA